MANMVSSCSVSFSVKAETLKATLTLAEDAEADLLIGRAPATLERVAITVDVKDEVLLVERGPATWDTWAAVEAAPVEEVLLVERVLGGTWAFVDDAEAEVLLVDLVFDIFSRSSALYAVSQSTYQEQQKSCRIPFVIEFSMKRVWDEDQRIGRAECEWSWLLWSGGSRDGGGGAPLYESSPSVNNNNTSATNSKGDNDRDSIVS